MALSRAEQISLSQWERAKEIFETAISLEPYARDSYLVEACADNSALFNEVKELLDYHEQATSFLQDPSRSPAYDSSPEPVFSIGEFVASRFRIMRLIGHGGMGEVYVAYDLELGELVALKTLRPAMLNDARMITSFKQEVHLARRVTHGNVCRIFDLFWHQGGNSEPIAVLSMEYLAGQTLLDRIRECGPFSPSSALPIIRQIADGLDAAHRFGIIHGDFKSSNVMLVPQPQGGARAVITDFGLARDQQSTYDPSKEGAILGTPAYLAPEQLEKVPLNSSIDIYAFGVVLYEMLTGRLPLQGGAGTLIGLKSRDALPLSPKVYCKGLSPSWGNVILTCLSRDPKRRPGSALQISTALTARKRWPVRHKLASGIVVALATVILIGALILNRPHKPNPEAQAALDGARAALQNNSKAGFDRAIEDYNLAIRLDPKWAQPWAELAYAYADSSNFRFIDGSTAFQRAREAASHAVALDSSLAKAYGALGWTQSLDFDEWPKAEDSFRRALGLDPEDGQIRHWFGVYLRKMGRFKEAEEQDKSALALTHKLDANVWCEMGFLYWTSGQLTKFHNDIMDQLVAYHNVDLTQYLYARLLKLEGKFDEAEEALAFAERLGMNHVTVLVERASLEVYRGDLSAARKYIAQLEEMAKTQEVDGLLLAGVYAGLGDRESAFRVLDDAYRRKDNTLLSLATSPVLQPLRDDPRFRSLLQRLHFTDQIMQQMEFNSSSVSGESSQPKRTGTS